MKSSSAIDALRYFLSASLVVVFSAQHANAQSTALTKFHEQLAREVGTWDGELSLWLTPGAEPVKSKATETIKMLGKLWSVGEFEGEMLGEKFFGRSQLGYDPHKKKYVGSWIDSMTPVLGLMTGDYDAETHTLTMTFTTTDMETGKPAQSRNVTKYIDNNTRVFQMFMLSPEGGEPTKFMEIHYKRRVP